MHVCEDVPIHVCMQLVISTLSILAWHMRSIAPMFSVISRRSAGLCAHTWTLSPLSPSLPPLSLSLSLSGALSLTHAHILALYTL